jgi:hypothetical protein
VLLVDDHQAQALELHVAGKQLVRADDDVDLAAGELFDDLGRFLGAPEARELRDLHRPLGEAVAEGLQVLLGEERGGAQDHHLLAVGDRDERRAQCDLGLAEADIAAHQAVHRLARDHVGHHGLDGRRLVDRFLEAEAVGEGLEVVLLDGKRMSQPRCALGIQREQLRRGVAHLLRGARLGLVPLAAAELVQRRLLGLRAAVAADDAELRDRHIQLVAAFVLQEQELVRPVAEIQVHQALVAPDAVLLVHHRIAHLELGEVAQHAFDRDALLGDARAPAHHAGIELGLGDHRPAFVGKQEAVRKRRDAQRQGGAAFLKLLIGTAHGRRKAVLREIRRHRLAASGRLGRHHHAQRRALDEALQRGERVGRAPVDRHGWQRGRKNGVRPLPGFAGGGLKKGV